MTAGQQYPPQTFPITPSPGVATTSPPPPQEPLPRTGGEALPWVNWGLGLVALGGVVLALAKKRRKLA